MVDATTGQETGPLSQLSAFEVSVNSHFNAQPRVANNFAHTIARPARFQLLGNVARSLLLFIHQLLIARWYGASVLGLFALSTSAVQVAGMLSQLGGDYVVLRTIENGTEQLVDLSWADLLQVSPLGVGAEDAAVPSASPPYQLQLRALRRH